MNLTAKPSADPLRPRSPLLALVTGPLTPKTALRGHLAGADGLFGGAIKAAVADGEITGKAGNATVLRSTASKGPRRLAVVGVGDEPTRDDWEAAGRAIAKAARAARVTRVAVAFTMDVDEDAATACVEGIAFGAYRFDRFRGAKADDQRDAGLTDITVLGPGLAAARAQRVGTVMRHTAAARDLGNTPANYLPPTELAAYATRLAAATPGLSCKVLRVRDLQRLAAGGILAVGQGSAEPPCMIVMRWTPPKSRAKGLLGLVGKAVTFDSGGISIKPSAGMEEMKMDMCGGAAVIEGIAAIAELGLPVSVMAVVPSAENMPSGTAIKPGDVYTAMNGKTVEVVNTDAEGRLILADALTYAARNGATRIVEFSTLTGAMVVALGEVYAGLFGSHDDWTATVREAAEASGDIAWHMPLHEGYRPLIKSSVADLSNAAKKRQAGGVYAAMFLREFAEGVPYCHLDIAGTAMRGGAASGYGVRLIAELTRRLATSR